MPTAGAPVDSTGKHHTSCSECKHTKFKNETCFIYAFMHRHTRLTWIRSRLTAVAPTAVWVGVDNCTGLCAVRGCVLRHHSSRPKIGRMIRPCLTNTARRTQLRWFQHIIHVSVCGCRRKSKHQSIDDAPHCFL